MWLSIAGLGISVMAVLISVWTARAEIRAERESLGAGEVTDIYADWRRITELRLDNWQHTHILEPPANYVRTKALLQAALPEMSEQDVARHLLQERAVALGVFQLFEQTLYQVEHAARTDRRREAFLRDVLDYMTSCLFQNPRLLFLWREDGGGLAADFEDSTKAYYAAHVDAGDRSRQDSQGLFSHDLCW
jgi:hypothetical protein